MNLDNNYKINNFIKKQILFKHSNEIYTNKLIDFIKNNKFTQNYYKNENLLKLFHKDNFPIITKFFTNIQSELNFNLQQLAEFVFIIYEDGDVKEDIAIEFLNKLRKLIN